MSDEGQDAEAFLEEGSVEILKPADLVERMMGQNPGIIGKLNQKQLSAIVRSTLQIVAAEVNGRDEGRVRISGLGNFSVRQVERQKDGARTSGKRIMFRPARPREE